MEVEIKFQSKMSRLNDFTWQVGEVTKGKNGSPASVLPEELSNRNLHLFLLQHSSSSFPPLPPAYTFHHGSSIRSDHTETIARTEGLLEVAE